MTFGMVVDITSGSFFGKRVRLPDLFDALTVLESENHAVACDWALLDPGIGGIRRSDVMTFGMPLASTGGEQQRRERPQVIGG